MATTPTDPPSDREAKRGELKWLLEEDSPQGEELRTLRDLARTGFFGLEPLLEHCEEDESESSDGPALD